MSLRDNELARRQDDRVELRPQPLRVRWSFNQLLCADGHELRAVFTCSARALPDPSERRMLEETLLGPRYSVSDEDLADHFDPALSNAAGKAAAMHSALEWTEGGLNAGLIETLRAAARPIAFACGVELLAPFHVDLQSPGFQRERLRKMQQSLAEQQAAGQLEHVQHATELVKQFHQLRRAAPDLPPGKVLEQISPADRGQVLQMLLLGSGSQAAGRMLWAVAGPYLVRINLDDASAQPVLIPLTPALGPLRSVQTARINDEPRLLIGARSGFMVIDPQAPADARLFTDSGADSALGFSRVIYWGPKQGFAASHAERGVVRWDAASPDAPAASLGPQRLGVCDPIQPGGSGSIHAAGPRNLQAWDESTLLFGAGNKLLLSDMEEVQVIESASAAPIVGIVPDGPRFLVVHEDGTICSIDRDTRKLSCLTRRASRVRSVGALPWMGGTRLLLAGEDGAVDCLGLDDPVVTEYQSPHRGLRSVTGCAQWVAGICADRQRLTVWQSWDGRQPAAEIYLTGLTRHRIADVAFA